jgi:hypothetical protein
LSAAGVIETGITLRRQTGHFAPNCDTETRKKIQREFGEIDARARLLSKHASPLRETFFVAKRRALLRHVWMASNLKKAGKKLVAFLEADI